MMTVSRLVGTAIATVLVLTTLSFLANGTLAETVKAQFTVEVRDKTATFTDTSVGAYTIVQHEWNFGDRNESYAVNPVHTYAGYGNYTVWLRVTTYGGAVFTCSKLVDIPRNGSMAMDETTHILVVGFSVALILLLVGMAVVPNSLTRALLLLFFIFVLVLLVLVLRGNII